MEKIYSTQDKFVKNISTTIENEILTLSEEKIDQILNGIDKLIDNQDECNKLYVLEKLRDKSEKKIVYYQARQHKKYDWDSFKYSIIISIITVALVYLLYISITHYDSPIIMLAEITQGFKRYTVTIIECAKRYIEIVYSYVQVTTSAIFSSNQLVIVSRFAKPFVPISVGIYGGIKGTMHFLFAVIDGCFYRLILRFMILLFGCIILFIIGSLPFIFFWVIGWLWPKYQQYYDKWCTVEEKIEKKIFFLKQQGARNKYLFDTRNVD